MGSGGVFWAWVVLLKHSSVRNRSSEVALCTGLFPLPGTAPFSEK